MTTLKRSILTCLGLFLSLAPAWAGTDGAQSQPSAPLKTCESKYYVIHTDLDEPGVKEAIVRMNALAEEYHRRTFAFSGKITRKLPFYLFRRSEDYCAAGGKPGSAGVFLGDKLMAIAGNQADGGTWQRVQHEAFHQFAASVIRGSIPTWVNEGLAEYFGLAIFTGDGFTTGLVPPGRLVRLKAEIRLGRLKPFSQIMTLSNHDWNDNLTMENYDQAWSMIHFLVHADNHRYVQALNGFMTDIGSGVAYPQAWVRNFGRDVDAFEGRWRKYWMDMGPNPTADGYVEATVATLTSFMARAAAQGQQFREFHSFAVAAEENRLAMSDADWLPPSLLQAAMGMTRRPEFGHWGLITNNPRQPQVVCILDGNKFLGVYSIRNGHPESMEVQISSVSSGKPIAAVAASPPPSPASRPVSRPASSSPAATQPAPPADIFSRP